MKDEPVPSTSTDNTELESEAVNEIAMDTDDNNQPSDAVCKFLNGEISFNDYLDRMDKIADADTVEPDSPDADTKSVLGDIIDEAEELPSSEDSSEDETKAAKPKGVRRMGRSKLSATLRGVMGQANVYYAQGDTQTAVKMCLEIIKEQPQASEPFKTLASIYEEMDESEKALQMRLIAAHLGPASKEEWLELARMLKQRDHIKQAVVCYTRAINYDDLNLDLYEQRAALMKEGKIASVEAYGLLRILYKLDPQKDGEKLLDLCIKVARMYYNDKKYEKSCKTLKYAFEKRPDLIDIAKVNLYLDVLITIQNFHECLNVMNTFCNVEFQSTKDPFTIVSCTVPEEIPIDIRAKLIITLIHFDSFENAKQQIAILLEENPEVMGDLFFDVAMELIDKEQYEDAITLLEPLTHTDTESFNQVTLWFKLAHCYKQINKSKECHDVFRRALQCYPDDKDLKLKFCEELKSAHLYQEAIELTKDDDMSVLIYERCNMYYLIKDYDNFIKTGLQLFRLHCKEIKTIEDYSLLLDALRSTKSFKEIISSYVPVTIDSSVTIEQEWDVFVKIFNIYLERKDYDLLQQLTLDLSLSYKFVSNRDKLRLAVAIASFLNNDYEISYDMMRYFKIQVNINTQKFWNFFNLLTYYSAYSRLHKFLIRLLMRSSDDNNILVLFANNCLSAGTYKYSLNDYSILFQEKQTPMVALLLSVAVLHMSCQKWASIRHSLVSQCLAFLHKYKDLRGEPMNQEIYYNFGRAFHQLDMLPQAVHYYKKALECERAIDDIFDLKAEIAYNLHVIYINSGQPRVANMYLQKDELKMSDSKFSEKTKFSVICNVLEKIEKQKNKDQKADIMKQFIVSFREQSKSHLDDSFYPILRLILPVLERERGPYGIKEHTLAKMYIRILGLPKEGKDAQKLLNFRFPKTSSKGTGDFAEVAYWILRSRFENTQKLTVFDVNQYLDNISSKHASHDPRGVDNELHAMLLNMSPEEQKWLIRIVLKDISVGLSQNKILSLFHPDAIDLFDVSNDIRKVCTMLKDPSVRLHEIEIEMFQPFKAMLSQRCDIQMVEKDIITAADHFYVETKFDGERFQLHCNNGEYKYYSRNGYEYTDTFGANSSNGVLTPKISRNLKDVQSIILDGEMMCWHKSRKCFTAKGKNIDVKYVKEADANQACFVVFDILYLNGTVLTNKPFIDRVELLEKHMKPEEGIFMISNRTRVTTGEQIMNCLNQAITDCEEGIVVKNPYSVYKPNSRKAGWYKIKPEYTEGLMVELDLLVIGGYYGDGRRRGIVSQFLLGVADSNKNEDGEPRAFYSVAKVGSGYSDDELAEVDKKLQGNWKRVSSNHMPTNVEWTKEKPDVWIAPKSSIILQVKATEVGVSDAFKVGYTLRFPRVQKVRLDKSWYDCLTLEEFTRLRESNCGKLTTSYATKLATADSKKLVKRPKKVITIDEQFQSKRSKNVELCSNIFQGLEICVLTGYRLLSKFELESKIAENGGVTVQHPGASLYCVVTSDKNNIRVKNIIELKKYNVLKTDWILECIDKKKLLNWGPHHILSLNPETEQKISDQYDEFGDSYYSKISIDRLRELMETTQSDYPKMSMKQMISLDKQLFSGGNPFAIFRGCSAYFQDSPQEVSKYIENLQHSIAKEVFKFYGGLQQESIDKSTTHVVYCSKSHVPNDLHSRSRVILVSSNWILDCEASKTRLPESAYG